MHRCFCGGDWPKSLLNMVYIYTWSAYVYVLQGLTGSAKDLSRLLYDNARNFYKLEDLT